MKKLLTTLCLLAIAVSGALLARHVSLTHFYQVPFTSDENSYVFQAHRFAAGELALPAPPLEHVFSNPMTIVHPDRGWYSRYAPGHPLWLVPGIWLGDPFLMVYVAAALSLLGLAWCGWRLKLSPLGTAALLLISPFFLAVHGTLLSHTTGLLSSVLMVGCYLSWLETRRAGWLLGAGVGWSGLLLNRTWTALLLVVPIALHAIWTALQIARHANGTCLPHARLPRAWRRVVCGNLMRCRLCHFLHPLVLLGLTTLGGVALFFAYNYVTTGSYTTPTYLFYDPSQRVGFGLRHTTLGEGAWFEHTPLVGLGFVRDNLLLLNRWLFPFVGSAVLLLILTCIGWRRRVSPILVATTLCVWSGSIFFWYPGPHEVGPGYWTETLPMIILLCAMGFARILRWIQPASLRGPLAALLLIGFGTYSVGKYLPDALAPIRAQCKWLKPYRDAIQSLPAGSAVILDRSVPWVELFMRNAEGTNSPVVTMRTLFGGNHLIARTFTGRTYYLLEAGPVLTKYPEGELEAGRTAIDLEAGYLAHKAGTPVELGDERVLRINEQEEVPAEVMAFGRSYWLMPGRYSLEAVVSDFEIPTNAPCVLDLGRHHWTNTYDVTRQTCSGAGTGTVFRHEFTVGTHILAEPRFWYGGEGHLTLHRIRLQERE